MSLPDCEHRLMAEEPNPQISRCMALEYNPDHGIDRTVPMLKEVQMSCLICGALLNIGLCPEGWR